MAISYLANHTLIGLKVYLLNVWQYGKIGLVGLVR